MSDYLFWIGAGFVTISIVVIGLLLRASQKKTQAKRNKAQSTAAKNAKKRSELAKSIKKVTWQPAYCIDKGIIDNDHQYLFKLINTFNAKVPIYQNPAQMVPLLTQLTKYMDLHFKREINLQKAAGFPDINEHKLQHDELIKKYNSLISKAKKANSNNVVDVASEIGMFLQDWLLSHVLEHDIALRPYVERMREHAKTMSSLG
ncbi:MAG: hemerythrin family protein [Magnetovibrio sp.]|nr:hemerythrin family protein [Magnetovibrio sp.]